MESSHTQTAKVAPEVLRVDLILPSQTNHFNTMFGGEVLALMDKTAAIAAMRFCGHQVVTASSEAVDFYTPIHAGEMIEAAARVIYVGRTSMIVRVAVYAESAGVRARRLAARGYLSLVALGVDAKPVQVPELLIEDDHTRQEWQIGEAIRRAIDARRANR